MLLIGFKTRQSHYKNIREPYIQNNAQSGISIPHYANKYQTRNEWGIENRVG